MKIIDFMPWVLDCWFSLSCLWRTLRSWMYVAPSLIYLTFVCWKMGRATEQSVFQSTVLLIMTENLSLFRRCLFFCQKACFEGSDGISLKLHRRWLFHYLGRVCFHDVLLDMNTYCKVCFHDVLLDMNTYCKLCLFIIRMGGLFLGIYPLYIYVVHAHLIVI